VGGGGGGAFIHISLLYHWSSDGLLIHLIIFDFELIQQ
jgi:hypothetical protein